jgi:hypothetical protein
MPSPPALRWWLSITGSPEGPFDEAQIIARLNAGEVPPSALICLEGSQQWQSLSSWSAFAKELGAVQKSATPEGTVPSRHNDERQPAASEHIRTGRGFHHRKSRQMPSSWMNLIPWPIYLVLRFFKLLPPWK